jgi:subtilisin family serine protease
MKALDGVEIMHEYSIGNFTGYAAKMDADYKDTVLNLPEVDYIERNQKYYPTSEPCIAESQVRSWGLTRTNKRALDLDGTYDYRQGSGDDVDVYIIDTGIYLEHEDFRGRAFWGIDTADNPSSGTDRNGHGTHVAGTVMGTQYGLAKSATAWAVKVLGDAGFGTTAGVIAGVDWVVEHYLSRGNKKALGNMSLGGGKSTAMDTAVNNAVESGVIMAVAAGNDGFFPPFADACDYSPAAASEALTVASSDVGDRRSGFSNYGVCTNIFAPGSDITSAWVGSTTASNTISGTSMASPHVAGLAAVYWSHHPNMDRSEVESNIVSLGTSGVLSDTGAGSPNLLLFGDCNLS